MAWYANVDTGDGLPATDVRVVADEENENDERDVLFILSKAT